MTMDEKLYELMVQAEELQKHAVKLQKEAETAREKLDGAGNRVAAEIKSTGLIMALLVLGLAIVSGIVVCAGVSWWVNRLENRHATLTAEIKTLENTAAELKQRKIEVGEGEGKMWIVAPKGKKFVGSGITKDGRAAVFVE